MANELEVVGVLRSHLREMERAIEHARGLVMARDLMNDYANMGAAPRQSNLGKALDKQYDRLQAYLKDDDDDIQES